MAIQELDKYRTISKKVSNPGARWNAKRGGHEQKNYILEADDGTKFLLYSRKNRNDERDFSCGLHLVSETSRKICLARYNGSNHIHGDIRYNCHIHRATPEAFTSGVRTDIFAEETDRYQTLPGAMDCLVADWSIHGITPEIDDDAELFDGS